MGLKYLARGPETISSLGRRVTVESVAMTATLDGGAYLISVPQAGENSLLHVGIVDTNILRRRPWQPWEVP
jgi:hypothetical protein